MPKIGRNLVGVAAFGLFGCGSDERLGVLETEPPPACAPTLARANAGACPAPSASRLELDGLSAPVTVLRDRYGTAHVYATRLEDGFIAQGFLVASDRMPQIELLRRFARGELAEL